jgi:hypothetical protein
MYPLESVVGGIAHIVSPGDSVPHGHTPTGPGSALVATSSVPAGHMRWDSE